MNSLGKNEYGLNDYVISKMRSSFKELQVELISKANSKIKNAKHHLSLTREMCMYCGPHMVIDESLFASYVRTISELPDLDVERKIIRTCYYLIMEMLSADADQVLRSKFSSEISGLLQNETTKTGGRLCLGWRLSAKLAFLSNDSTTLLSTLTNEIKNLRYPEKQKRFLFGVKNAELEFKNQIESWNALFSALRRTGSILPIECLEVALVACTSPHVALARHAMSLVSELIEKSPSSAGPAFMARLKEGLFSLEDTLYCVHLLRACQSLVTAASTMPKDLTEIHRTMIQKLGDSRCSQHYLIAI